MYVLVMNDFQGVDLVARDSKGQVRVSLCHTMAYLTDPTAAEAFAARQGVELCYAMGFKAVIFEGDSQTIVQALLVDGVHRRTGNVDAHQLARMAVKQKVSHVWLESIPGSISDAVCKDL